MRLDLSDQEIKAAAVGLRFLREDLRESAPRVSTVSTKGEARSKNNKVLDLSPL